MGETLSLSVGVFTAFTALFIVVLPFFPTPIFVEKTC
jgi:hypothetical protein